MFNQKDLNLIQRRWLELLKDYDISIPYHQGKANVVADSLRRLSMGSTSHVKEEKKESTKHVHILICFGGRLMNSVERSIVLKNGMTYH